MHSRRRIAAWKNPKLIWIEAYRRAVERGGSQLVLADELAAVLDDNPRRRLSACRKFY